MILKLVVFLMLCKLTLKGANSTTDLYREEIRSLSELPMSKLIRIKSSLTGEPDASEMEESKRFDEKLSSTLPMALPLKSIGKKPSRRHGHYYEEKGKDTKITKIFQVTVTALSFLAFGGYLLTLVISAIRRNNTNGTGNVIVFSNLQNLQKFQRPKRNIDLFDPMESDFETDRLYRGMIMISEGYARYN